MGEHIIHILGPTVTYPQILYLDLQPIKTGMKENCKILTLLDGSSAHRRHDHHDHYFCV
ncbi:MAG: hypothetical protein ACI8RD_009672 [Bacillariaceae sp.]|jgi:hypothetical protein